jgi:DNA-binding LacI/PurR family transcriptional regulator
VAIVLPNDSAGTTGPAALSAAYRHVDIARLTGWRDGLQGAGIDWSRVPVASGPGKDRESGRRAAAALLDRPDRPTAIIALADELALGVIDTAAERGIAVPGELSVAGFDDIAAAGSTPALTTVRQPHARKGSEAVRLLLDPGAEASVLLPTELVIRASTAPPP